MASEKTERGVGLELIQWQTTMILVENINAELDSIESIWEERDEEWNLLTGQEPSSVILEHISPEHIYKGHRPSLILESCPKERYPNISVMAYMARPITGVVDQATNFEIMLDVESFVKGDTEGEVDARTHRTMEALHQVLVKNEDLNGLSFGWSNDPNVTITDIFTRKSTDNNDNWFFQGIRLRYNLTRHARLPSF